MKTEAAGAPPGARAASATDARRTRLPSIDALVGLSVIGATTPVIVAAVARVAEHWQPSGDQAAIARISHDVFSSNTPLLGMPSTISSGVNVTGGGTAHHLGPMLFWLFAIPDLIGRSSPNALVIAIALLNVACIAGVAWTLRRHTGPIGAIVAMAAISIMLVTLGRDVTVEIWNPYAALMPFLLFLVLAWAFANGDRVALPLAAVVGSFVIQCHVLYVVPVVAVTIASLTALLLSDRSTKRRAEGDIDAWRRSRRRSWAATVIVLALCWWTAAWDQLFHHGGNVTRLWNSLSRSSQPPLGFDTASRYVMRALALPPLFARHLTTTGALLEPVGWWIALSAAVAIVILAAGSWVLRSSAPAFARLGVLSFVTLASAWYVLARLPIQFGGPAVYRLRFVWIVSVFTWVAIVVVTGRALQPRFAPRAARVPDRARRSIATAVALAIVAGGAIASLPRHSISTTKDDTRVVTVLTDQLRASLPDRGPYLFRAAGAHAFGGIGFGVMWDLVRHGYDVRVLAGDPYLGAHHGVPRQLAIRRLLVVSSDGHGAAPVDWQRVAGFDSAPGLPAEVAHLQRRLVADLEHSPPRITAAGRHALATSRIRLFTDSLRELSAPAPDWDLLLRRETLLILAGEQLIRLDLDEAHLIARYNVLAAQRDDSVFTVYVIPTQA